MLNQPPQPTSEQIEQRLRLMDLRLDRLYPGYLATLEQLREPREWRQGGAEWNPADTQRHTCRYGSDNSERQQP